MPAGKLVKIGAWENGKFIGCVLFGLGATPNLSKAYDLKMTQCCELTRVSLTKHACSVTRVLAIAIKMLKKLCPGIQLIVSFADASQGHHGGIYQGSNWVYSGKVMLDTWLINGEKMHPRSVVAKFGSQSLEHVQKFDKAARKIWNYKHRYLMPLNDKIRQEIAHLSQPYPKRVEHDVNAPTFQAGKSGSNPTDALHSVAEL